MTEDFAVRCTVCGFTWNSPAMAEGVRMIGCCPKCKGGLEFGSRDEQPPSRDPDPVAAAPHLVLGLPRI